MAYQEAELARALAQGRILEGRVDHRFPHERRPVAPLRKSDHISCNAEGAEINSAFLRWLQW
jgi:hypothetical protein